MRLLYVASTCLIGCLIPFFGSLMGLIGAVGVGLGGGVTPTIV